MAEVIDLDLSRKERTSGLADSLSKDFEFEDIAHASFFWFTVVRG